MTQYRYIGDYAYVIHKGDNLVNVGYGDFVDLTSDEEQDEYNQRVISDGILVPVTKLSPEEPAKAEVQAETTATEEGAS